MSVEEESSPEHLVRQLLSPLIVGSFPFETSSFYEKFREIVVAVEHVSKHEQVLLQKLKPFVHLKYDW